MIQPLQHPATDLDDADSLYEIVSGMKVVKPIGTYENVLAGELHGYLRDHVRAHAIGRAVVDVLFDLPGIANDRRPDVAFVSFDRWPANRRPPSVNAGPVVPDLAAEIVSPTDHLIDVIEKVDEYFRAGARLVWLVLPRQERVYVYTSPTTARILTRSDDLTGDTIVPGFRMPLADLFPPPDEPAV
jgi:Uma2 family endonuclease